MSVTARYLEFARRRSAHVRKGQRQEGIGRPHSGITAGVETGGYGQNDGMNLALTVIVLLMLFIPFVLVGVLFVWGAAKDGQEDRAVQRRLGIRRRTRLGR